MRSHSILRGHPAALVVLLITFVLVANVVGAQALPDAKLPVLITSAGQSPGGNMMRLLFRQNGIESDFNQLAEARHLKEKKYNTLVVALGTSLKGMGAAGIDFDEELKRIQSLIDEAKRQGILLIGFHIEGEARRGGYDEDLISEIPQQLDYLVVRKDGNSDGVFTKISSEHAIPLKLVDKTMDVKGLLEEMFR